MTHKRCRSTLLLILLLALPACSDAQDPSPSNASPLQPLIYTERPDLSPEAAAVRERRLMRHLLDGSNASGNWGSLEKRSQTRRQPMSTAEALGQAMFTALVERDEDLWDSVFVAPADYAGMVHLELDRSRKFVDDIQGKSGEVWRSFEVGRASEAPEGGFAGLLEFHSLELGEGRTLDGPIAEEGEPIAQHWGNVLRLRLKGSDVIFELRVPKILRIAHPRHHPNQPGLGVASAVQMSSQLEVYLRAGLHLKPQLLETREYPYPLAVGNFWRYRRSLQDAAKAAEAGPDSIKQAPTQQDPTKQAPSEQAPSEQAPSEQASPEDANPALSASGLRATETLLEVTSVDRYGSWRLVTLRRSYNDEKLTTIDQHWLVLPRRIYRCSSVCRVHADDLGWLLSYLDRQTPLFRFPMRLDEGWGEGGQSGEDDEVFQVAGDWHDILVPAGSYANTVAIEGTGPLEAIDRYYRGRGQTRYFSHGRGVVQRVIHASTDGDQPAVVEKLIESRIMPR
ncbi:hypothetical protein FIV42_13955 [Persicimonas caeni]|uniref:Uncharacterized protein n=1 Tax=Persicimonas caeni TaxID=2292766 RepID=A0A4Y6PVP2_PERCE|nr:hypothetical protein [Persicimonas caeni]QDG51805.1 hypothetical protein FIV42_13955 [Persicimonas caeni]QED33026.1 hypothetical protein FRD00_13950 [Persicimonas caeni]